MLHPPVETKISSGLIRSVVVFGVAHPSLIRGRFPREAHQRHGARACFNSRADTGVADSRAGIACHTREQRRRVLSLRGAGAGKAIYGFSKSTEQGAGRGCTGADARGRRCRPDVLSELLPLLRLPSQGKQQPRAKASVLRAPRLLHVSSARFGSCGSVVYWRRARDSQSR